MSEADGIDTTARPSGTGCVECGTVDGWWFHLRRCAECGHIGCCDSSPSQQATAHYRETGHRYMQSYEPGEDWFWDFETEEALSGPILADPTSHPLDQPAPGPEGRVPADWQSLLHA
ncbi:UBP-type zinc finger domain-containing protein [Humibacter soli]